MEFHLIVAMHRADALKAARELVKWLEPKGVTLAADHESASELGVQAAKPQQLGKADLLISYGGDGTLITAADLGSTHGCPVLGVAFGNFGFVTQCKGEDVPAVIERFMAGECEFEERMMVQADIKRDGETLLTVHALNEVTVQRSARTKMLIFRVSVDGIKLTSYPADGVLLATPTGSTGYNLSAGGPIVDPRLHAFVLSAIAPHTLSSRPLVLGPESVVDLALVAPGEAVVMVDGRLKLNVQMGDHIEVRRSPRRTRFLTVVKNDFERKLNALLFWGQSVWRDIDN